LYPTKGIRVCRLSALPFSLSRRRFRHGGGHPDALQEDEKSLRNSSFPSKEIGPHLFHLIPHLCGDGHPEDGLFGFYSGSLEQWNSGIIEKQNRNAGIMEKRRGRPLWAPLIREPLPTGPGPDRGRAGAVGLPYSILNQEFMFST
jgi:hypothetical protein